jgi:hypothetical protein
MYSYPSLATVLGSVSSVVVLRSMYGSRARVKSLMSILG